MGFVKNILKKLKKFYSFEDKLISELKHDHQKLFSLFNKIEKNIQKRNYEKIPEILKKFHYEYRLHIIYEDNYFYTYMKRKYKNDDKILEFINQKQEEMKSITKAIADFINRFDSIKEIQTEKFKNELQKLGKALKSRVEFEEKELYTLYS
ncbi:putative hemerythrin HHE cation binding domain subfamily [Nautilia profundicola AmH]|uniref:Hemerythrin HHE cation binding domain subfamily n=1 Tax=Nautilia profundicola (strain ATCC BAA-1463 / DSM 18972 / AmH) TaxID=598659 RepID=B9L7E3_NAUPA|nr:hemerythrin domain-containing protein [Nautilia profundicola]ACM92382.1 putative hemerythrin HHE cation binding domain subfamily [Nautilia profundicola AmH]